MLICGSPGHCARLSTYFIPSTDDAFSNPLDSIHADFYTNKFPSEGQESRAFTLKVGFHSVLGMYGHYIYFGLFDVAML